MLRHAALHCAGSVRCCALPCRHTQTPVCFLSQCCKEMHHLSLLITCNMHTTATASHNTSFEFTITGAHTVVLQVQPWSLESYHGHRNPIVLITCMPVAATLTFAALRVVLCGQHLRWVQASKTNYYMRVHHWKHTGREPEKSAVLLQDSINRQWINFNCTLSCVFYGFSSL